jgi:hypothetical protein
VNAAAVRIAVSSSTFRRPLAAGSLTQLEWLERCASELGVDGVLADVSDFPRRDAEYVAQLRKVAIDLGLVAFGIDAERFLDLGAPDEARRLVLTLASDFGVAVVRTRLPAPGDVPPATFVEAVGVARTLSRAAKAANVTVLVAEAAGTLGPDLAGVKRFLKDVDSAWLRACPSALTGAAGPRDRYPAFSATPDDDAGAVASAASRAWVILDAAASDRAWEEAADSVTSLRTADAERLLSEMRRDRSGRLDPG